MCLPPDAKWPAAAVSEGIGSIEGRPPLEALRKLQEPIPTFGQRLQGDAHDHDASRREGGTGRDGSGYRDQGARAHRSRGR